MSSVEELKRMKQDFVKSLNEENFDKTNAILDELEKVNITVNLLRDTGLGKTLASTKKKQTSVLSLCPGLTDRITKLITKWKNAADKEVKEKTTTVSEEKPKHLMRRKSATSPKSDASPSSPSPAPAPASHITPTNYSPSFENNQKAIEYIMDDSTAHPSAIRVRTLLLKAFKADVEHLDSYDQCTDLAEKLISLQKTISNVYECTDKPLNEACKNQILLLQSGLAANGDLRRQLIAGKLDYSELAHADVESLKSKATKELEEKQREEKWESSRADWAAAHMDEINRDSDVKNTNGMFTCPKCHSGKTTFYQLQTRSADEPMTCFIQCLDCKYRWRR